MNEYKVTVVVETEYSTIVQANSEEEAREIALEREAPPYLACYDEGREFEWQPEPLYEFPNLGKNEEPDVELIEEDV